MGKISASSGLFKGISWGVTALIVVSLLGFTLWKIFPSTTVAAAVQPTRTQAELSVSLPPLSTADSGTQAIVRRVSLKTDITAEPNFTETDYTVQAGDSVFSIAQSYNIKPETLLWANYDVLQDNPDSLRVGQVLKVPPVDGVYYQWQDGDTVDSVAKLFSANVDDIINWPGNNIDLTNPAIKTGTYVMVPGGQRALVQWIVPSMAVGQSGTSNVGQATCPPGPEARFRTGRRSTTTYLAMISHPSIKPSTSPREKVPRFSPPAPVWSPWPTTTEPIMAVMVT